MSPLAGEAPGWLRRWLDRDSALIDKRSMKLHLAAVLAMAGWYLMTPPLQDNGRYDTSAPLSKWRVESGFGNGQDCKKTVADLIERASKQARRDDLQELKVAQCVSADDPRIKGD
jgi:hypothetical protein